MDATDTSFPAHSFDAIIDKSTIDCLFCCTHPTHPPARMLMAECYRLLRPRCPLLLVSLNKPRKVRCGTYEFVVVLVCMRACVHKFLYVRVLCL
jgi:hypothetical protein